METREYLGTLGCIILFLRHLCLILLLFPMKVLAEEAESPAELKPRRWQGLSGGLDAGIDIQRSDHESDINLNQTLRLNFDPPNRPRLHFRGSVWLHEDLDSDEARYSVLRDINDASSADVRARLLYLYLDADDVWGDSVLRVGRQRILEGIAYNRIDGLYFQRQFARGDAYIFGGVRASLYDDAHDDPVFGGGADFRLDARTRVAMDWYYAQENRSRRDVVFRVPFSDFFRLNFPRRVKQEFQERAVALSVWRDIFENLRLYGRYVWKDGNGDELHLTASGHAPRWDLSYEVAFRSQLTRAGDQVNDLTSFFRVLGRFEPYYNVFAAIHRPISERTLLSIEAEFHDAENDDPLSANRDYERFALILTREELFKNTDATISVEHWSVTGGEGSFAVTGELRRRWERVELRVGADFERYEDRIVEYNDLPFLLDRARIALVPGTFPGFNPLVGLFDTRVVETHENIYSILTKLAWAVREDQGLTTELIYEQDEGPDSPYWRFKAEYSIRF